MTHFCKKRQVSNSAVSSRSGHACYVFTEIYIEALLVDEGLADQVWEAWDEGEINDWVACLVWWLIAGGRFTPESGR